MSTFLLYFLTSESQSTDGNKISDSNPLDFCSWYNDQRLAYKHTVIIALKRELDASFQELLLLKCPRGTPRKVPNLWMHVGNSLGEFLTNPKFGARNYFSKTNHQEAIDVLPTLFKWNPIFAAMKETPESYAPPAFRYYQYVTKET